MTTEIIETKEIEIAGEKAIIKLLKITRDYPINVIYFRIVGSFKGYEIINKNPILERLREKFKSKEKDELPEKSKIDTQNTLIESPTIENKQEAI